MFIILSDHTKCIEKIIYIYIHRLYFSYSNNIYKSPISFLFCLSHCCLFGDFYGYFDFLYSEKGNIEVVFCKIVNFEKQYILQKSNKINNDMKIV
ncbi:hypothetical protein [Plasmodium yoelii yoelii]|uniref:Uncharacterized protein n=1 Tax=Plasmodium yoelii yoelii TaxID=73239 RepID=Q7RAX3_PLAYO|nr:hypothetical protein [Plasmodium yoelii yoelii]